VQEALQGGAVGLVPVPGLVARCHLSFDLHVRRIAGFLFLPPGQKLEHPQGGMNKKKTQVVLVNYSALCRCTCPMNISSAPCN